MFPPDISLATPIALGHHPNMTEPERADGPKRKRNPPVDVRITQTVEMHRSLRLGIVCLCIVLCVWKIADCVVKLKDEPPSVKITLAILAALTALVSQTPLLWRVVVRVRRFTRDTVGRLTRLEQAEDPGRTSSDLLPDGTDPPGESHETSR